MPEGLTWCYFPSHRAEKKKTTGALTKINQGNYFVNSPVMIPGHQYFKTKNQYMISFIQR